VHASAPPDVVTAIAVVCAGLVIGGLFASAAARIYRAAQHALRQKQPIHQRLQVVEPTSLDRVTYQEDDLWDDAPYDAAEEDVQQLELAEMNEDPSNRNIQRQSTYLSGARMV
jgi:hypothetical protein